MSWHAGEWFLNAGKSIRIGVVMKQDEPCQVITVKPERFINYDRYGDLRWYDQGTTLKWEDGECYKIYWLTFQNVSSSWPCKFSICGTPI